MKRIRILFFTGNRAEFTFIHNAIESLSKKNFYSEILISGSHLDKKFGNTIEYIKKKLHINFHKIKINSSSKNISKASDYYSELSTKFNKFLKKNFFDYIFISSDRFESFAIANVAFMNQLQIIHYEGGDITLGGSYDDYLRHSISRLASLHFVTNKFSKLRLIKFGEERKRIENVGLLSLKKKKYDLKNILNDYKLDPDKFTILFTYHPVVKRKNKNYNDIKVIINSLEKLLKENELQIIITNPNFDPYCNLILKGLNNLKKKKYKNVKFYKSLGTENYHKLLYYCGKSNKGLCVGNSSSGIKEADFFNCPAINIGPRQNLRTKSKNVIDVKINQRQVYKKIKLLFSKNIKKKLKNVKKIYYKKNFSKKLSDKIFNHYKKDFFNIKRCTY